MPGALFTAWPEKALPASIPIFRTSWKDIWGDAGPPPNLPLALGFGVKDRADVDFIKGKADIAVIGTQTIRLMEKEGIDAVGDFIRGLR